MYTCIRVQSVLFFPLLHLIFLFAFFFGLSLSLLYPRSWVCAYVWYSLLSIIQRFHLTENFRWCNFKAEFLLHVLEKFTIHNLFEILFFHHYRFNWEIIGRICSQIQAHVVWIAVIFVVQSTCFGRCACFRFHVRRDSLPIVASIQMTHQMILPTEFRWTKFTLESWRNTNALVAHMAL